MSWTLISSGSQKREIDAEKTYNEYNNLITKFLGSPLFAADPSSMSDTELEDFASSRTNNTGGCSWIESTEKFFSACQLERVIHVNDKYPWDQLYFQPWKNFPIITLNRFRRESLAYLCNSNEVLSLRKKNRVLGTSEDTTVIRYFTARVGKPFIFCYCFDVIDDYNKHRFCLRFAEDTYKREALLQTQSFAINYFLHHPCECLPCPYLADGSGWHIGDIPAMNTILKPILAEKKTELESLQKRVAEQMITFGLPSEII